MTIMAWLASVVVMLAMLCVAHTAEFNKFDSEFDQDDSDVAKWLAETECFHEVDDTGAVTGPATFYIDAIENDPNFYGIENCVMLDYGDLIMSTITEITDAGCTQPDRVSMTDTDPEYKHWAFEETYPDATTSATAGAYGSSNCGAYKDGTIIYLAMHCFREDGHLKLGDAIFLAQCDAATERAVITVVKYGIQSITGLAEQFMLRRYKVSFDVLDGSIPADLANDVPKSSFELGEAGRLRFCIEIDSANGDTRTEFMDGFDPMGAVIASCVAKRDPSQEVDAADPDTADVETVGIEFVTANACGTGSHFALQLAADVFAYKWVKASTDGANSNLRTPNCFYTTSYEVTAFVGKTIGGTDRKSTITCSIAYYCTSSTDANCFGGGTGLINDPDYPVCPAGFIAPGRRKRNDRFNVRQLDMPKTVNTSFTVRFSSENTKTSTKEPCFKKTTFFALTGALVVLMVFTLAVVAVLLYKLMSDKAPGSENSKTAMRDGLEYGSQYSKSGYSNKAFSEDKRSFHH